MKRSRTLLICSCLILIMFFICIKLYTNYRMSIVEQEVVIQNSSIEEIESVHAIGRWGEWFSQFELVVKKDGSKYRIWTNNIGEIIDEERLNN